MTNESDQQQNKCALCGKFIREQQESKSAVLSEVIDGTSYTFDKNECMLMFKRLRSVYGAQFENSLVPHEQFVSDPFWNRAIPTVQEINEIEIEKKAVGGDEDIVLAKQDTIKLIEDPVEIQRTAVEIGTAAKNEVLIIFSTPNAFHRQERLGGIQALKNAVEKRGINARILTPKDESIESTVRTLLQQGKHPKIEMRYIEPGLQSQMLKLKEVSITCKKLFNFLFESRCGSISSSIGKIILKGLEWSDLVEKFDNSKDLIVNSVQLNPREVKRFINNIILARSVTVDKPIDRLIAVQALTYRDEWNIMG